MWGRRKHRLREMRQPSAMSADDSSGLRGHRRTNLTIFESADHALFKMVRYVLLRPLRPELDGQDPFQTFQTLAKQLDRASPLSVKRGR
jgi:hypothetical protein